MERRLVAYHYALVSALQNTDLVDGELKKRAVKCALDAFFAIYQVGLIYAPLIAKHKVYVWHGVVFVNQIEFAPSDAPDEDLKRAFWIMMGAAHAVAETGANSLGLRKLGEVFKAVAEGEVGFRAFFNYTCVLRSKSPTWSDTAERIILNADRKSFYLREMLNSTFTQFNAHVNSGQDRDRLKKLVASIRAKRELKKDTPGSKAITRVLDRLEKQQAFAPRKAPGTET